MALFFLKCNMYRMHNPAYGAFFCCGGGGLNNIYRHQFTLGTIHIDAVTLVILKNAKCARVR